MANKTNEFELVIHKISDFSKKIKKKKKKKDDDDDDDEDEDDDTFVEMRSVQMKNKLVNFTHTAKKKASIFKDLDKVADMNLPIKITLIIGEDPQKKLF